MLATSTHDSKRGEDVRTRIDALSEMPAVWRLALRRWRQVNRRHSIDLGGRQAPSRNDEYLLYQTLLGAWPTVPLDVHSLADFRGRIKAYMQKAAREAKVHTSWLNPDTNYESALDHFIDRLLASPDNNRFIDAFLPLQRRVARIGCVNSLAQTLVKLTSPGVPDTYQGTETWNLDLVDPDNRRAVDFTTRARLLRELNDDPARDIAETLLARWPDGRVKLWLTWRLLELRRRRDAWFARAGYMPVATEGEHAQRVCAYARSLDNDLLLCVVPRLWSNLVGDSEAWPVGAIWGDTTLTLPRGARLWRNVLTGARVAAEPSARTGRLVVADALATFPVGVFELERESPVVA
jgi:(1->4)-alpha-D-glucan 1-alpha-D-glucosylmutase